MPQASCDCFPVRIVCPWTSRDIDLYHITWTEACQRTHGTTSSFKHLRYMEKLSFDHVTVKSPRTGRILIVRNADDALIFLTQHWSKNVDEKHTIACEICRKAIAGKISVHSARGAFTEAAQEARLLIVESTGPQMVDTAIAHQISAHKPNEQH